MTKKSAFLRDLESGSTLVPCQTPFDRDMPGWIEARVRKAGGTINRDALRRLMEVEFMREPVDQLNGFFHRPLRAGDYFSKVGRAALGRFVQGQKPDLEAQQSLGDFMVGLPADLRSRHFLRQNKRMRKTPHQATRGEGAFCSAWLWPGGPRTPRQGSQLTFHESAT